MNASELIHGGLYLIHDTNDVVVRYDIISNSFRSEWYEYPLAPFCDDVCATDGDRFIFVKPIPLTEVILNANGFEKHGYWIKYIGDEEIDVCISHDIPSYYYGKPWNFCFPHANYVHQLQLALCLLCLNDLAENFKIK